MTFAAQSMTETNDAGGATARTIDKVQSSAHRAIDQASGAARPAVDRLATGAHDTVDRLAGAASHTAAALDQRSRHLRDQGTWVGESCRSYVQDRPLTSLGIAAAAGFLLSLALTRR
jgi:ElaB/YqjD/DUF883 family membrane-anchored ribosome-binding protein